MLNLRPKLYHYPVTRSARVKWLLHELLGDEFDTVRVALYDGEQFSPSFLRMNPSHALPVLELTDEHGSTLRLTESGAIVVYLADAFPDRGLAPASGTLSKDRADYLRMIFFCASSLDMMLWQIRIHEHVLPKSQRDSRTVERYRRKWRVEVEPQLEEKLRHGGFALGGKFTAADCMLCHAVMWSRAYHMSRSEVFDEYLERMNQRAAFRMAFSDISEFELEVRPNRLVDEAFTG